MIGDHTTDDTGQALADVMAFDDFTVDVRARTLEQAGQPVPLEPQVFDVLTALIEHRDRVVTKLELFDRVWGDRFVSPATLTSRIRDLRRVLGDSGRHQRIIKTAHGRGFQFVADVHPVAPPPTTRDLHNLKPLIGREAELAELAARLTSERLVTVVGPGGVGKTHLVQHATLGHDAIVAELADVRNADALHRSVLASAGGTERPDVEPADALVQFLNGRPTTLVLDNCEHVIADVAELVARLLRDCAELGMLATSRRPLGLSTERVLRLGPLPADDAVQLLVDHAARHGVELTDHHRGTVRDVCERLDCLPLALELAASKTRALPLHDLQRLLDDRFAVLTSDAHDAAIHHGSLDTAIGWSVDLLAEPQRRLLASLSVFVGSFDLAAVCAVCAPPDTPEVAVVTDLMALTDVSLVAFDAATGRYRLLESIRMFAETLDVDTDVTDRLRAYILSTVEAAGLMGTSTFSADISTITKLWPDVRAVAASAGTSGDADTLHRLIAGATRYAEQTFAFEVLDWVDTAIALDEAAGATTPASTHVAGAILRSHQSDFDRARHHLDHLADEDSAMSHLARLWHCYFTGDLAGADAAGAEIRRTDGGTGSYVEGVETVARFFLDKAAQRSFDPEAVARLDGWAGGDDRGLAIGAALCAALRLDWNTEADVAIEQLTIVVGAAQRAGLAFLTSGASTARSIALAISPESETSARVLRATLRSYADIGSWQFALADFAATALTLVRHGQAGAAAELLGARGASGFVGDTSSRLAESAAREARTQLGDARFDELVARGEARDPATATDLALAALTDIIGD